jgi:hypothetical protein
MKTAAGKLVNCEMKRHFCIVRNFGNVCRNMID